MGRPNPATCGPPTLHPRTRAVLADSVGPALLVVLDTLTAGRAPGVRAPDMFGVPFDEIGPMLGRSSAACKQLASRARHKVRGSEAGDDVDLRRQKEVVDAFLSASRTASSRRWWRCSTRTSC